jgi:hypothetical protein
VDWIHVAQDRDHGRPNKLSWNRRRLHSVVRRSLQRTLLYLSKDISNKKLLSNVNILKVASIVGHNR